VSVTLNGMDWVDLPRQNCMVGTSDDKYWVTIPFLVQCILLCITCREDVVETGSS
jgi:hypothetical protein